MVCYIISYDLVKERDYEKLYSAIKSYDDYAHITESTWAIVTNDRAAQIRNDLKKHMDSDDRIFVVRSGVVAAWSKVLCDSKWLKDNL